MTNPWECGAITVTSPDPPMRLPLEQPNAITPIRVISTNSNDRLNPTARIEFRAEHMIYYRALIADFGVVQESENDKLRQGSFPYIE